MFHSITVIHFSKYLLQASFTHHSVIITRKQSDAFVSNTFKMLLSLTVLPAWKRKINC